MNHTIKISIVTVCYNSEKTITNTIESVIKQDYKNIEYILIDGCSIDSTLNIIKKYSDRISKVISEKDNGIYDAINKGIKLATGDIVGILNSDDVFYDNQVVSRIANAFDSNINLDSVIGDIIFVNKNDKVHRHYNAKNWTPENFEWGMMPPHPTFYCKKNLFDKLGYYLNDFKIAADYELMMRFLLVNNITYQYLPYKFVKMSLGGASTKNLKSKIQINKEVLYACRINNVKTNFFKIYSKYFKKILEYI
jgi:glycosyltransferase involved in cell wall biosynthesis